MWEFVEYSVEDNWWKILLVTLVTQVEVDSNAFNAGLREGDVIVEVNHHPMENAEDVVRASERARADKILLRVWTQRRGSPGLVYMAVDNTKNE